MITEIMYCSAPDEADRCVGRPALIPSHHPSLYVIISSWHCKHLQFLSVCYLFMTLQKIIILLCILSHQRDTVKTYHPSLYVISSWHCKKLSFFSVCHHIYLTLQWWRKTFLSCFNFPRQSLAEFYKGQHLVNFKLIKHCSPYQTVKLPWLTTWL